MSNTPKTDSALAVWRRYLEGIYEGNCDVTHAISELKDIEIKNNQLRARVEKERSEWVLLTAQIIKLREEKAALEKEKARWESAVRNAVDCTNGREYEWGSRAENAFWFLHEAINKAE